MPEEENAKAEAKKKVMASLKELLVKLALMHEKFDQGVYDNNMELLITDENGYEEVDLEFAGVVQDFIAEYQ